MRVHVGATHFDEGNLVVCMTFFSHDPSNQSREQVLQGPMAGDAWIFDAGRRWTDV